MAISSLILICDHRGAGLIDQVERLEDQGWSTEVTHGLRETLVRLGREPRPDLVLLDPLAAGGSVELANLERVSGDSPSMPFLVVVDPQDDEAMLRLSRVLEKESWDVIRRDAPGEELQLRLRRLISDGQLKTEMSELRHRAFHDDRTNLLRPLAFQQRVREHFSASQRHGQDLALILIDLDRFGQINKVHDHTIGDALIASVGDVIRRTLRKEDVAGRLGGDEFAVILPYTRKIDAARVVNRLRSEIHALSGRPGAARSHVDVSASIGFETFDGQDLDSVETLRRHTEVALAASKSSGGNRGVYYRELTESQKDDESPGESA